MPKSSKSSVKKRPLSVASTGSRKRRRGFSSPVIPNKPTNLRRKIGAELDAMDLVQGKRWENGGKPEARIRKPDVPSMKNLEH